MGGDQKHTILLQWPNLTAWQSVDVICHCCLTMGPVTGLKSLLATVIGATGSAWQKRWLHLSVLSPHNLQHLLDQPCVQHALYTIARPDSQFLLYMCVLSCMIIILWPEFQSHSDNSHVHANGSHSACALTQACLHSYSNDVTQSLKCHSSWSY